MSPKVSNLDSLAQNQVSCQLDEGRIYEANMSKNFFFWGSCQVRTDDSGLQSRDITNYTKEPIFWV